MSGMTIKVSTRSFVFLLSVIPVVRALGTVHLPRTAFFAINDVKTPPRKLMDRMYNRNTTSFTIQKIVLPTVLTAEVRTYGFPPHLPYCQPSALYDCRLQHDAFLVMPDNWLLGRNDQRPPWELNPLLRWLTANSRQGVEQWSGQDLNLQTS